MKLLVVFFCATRLCHGAVFENQDTGIVVTVNGYVDAMYSTRFDNSLTTIPYSMQPSVNNQVHIDLACVSSVATYKSLSAHVALQTGKYTEANYSGADYNVRFLQELNLQFKAQELEITAGIMPAHTGYCNTIGINNLVVTQTMLADATLYYENGLKVQYAFQNVTAAVLLVQGWQRIIDNNKDNSIGTALCWQADSAFKVNYNTLTGNDLDTGSSVRSYHDVWAEYKNSRTTLAVIANAAFERNKRPMHYLGMQAQYKLSKEFAVTGRWENINDIDQVVFKSMNNEEFVCDNFSVNLDYALSKMFGVRGEIRTSSATKPIFNGSKTITFMTFAMYFRV